MKWPPFKGFLGLYSPKYCLIWLKLWPEVVSNKTNIVFQKSFKILNFESNGTHPKFTVLLYFGARFTARKPKILLKTRIFAKTTYILRNIKKWKPQFPKKLLYPCKIKQKKKIFFGPTLSLNCPLSLLLKAIINSNISYNTTIYLDVKFQLLGICRSRIYPEETTTFLWFRTQLDPFWGVWGQYLQ